HNKITNTNNRILDLLLSTECAELDVKKLEFPLVDEDSHHPSLDVKIYLRLENNVNFTNKHDKTKLDFRKANFAELYSAMARTDWSIVYSTKDVDNVCESFYKVLNNLFEKQKNLQKLLLFLYGSLNKLLIILKKNVDNGNIIKILKLHIILTCT